MPTTPRPTRPRGALLAIAALIAPALQVAPAHGNGEVPEWIEKMPVDLRLYVGGLAINAGARSSKRRLDPEEALSIGQAALRAQRFPENPEKAGRYLGPEGVPLVVSGWVTRFHQRLQGIDGSSLKVARYDRERIGELLGTSTMRHVEARGADPRVAELTVHQLLTGGQVEFRANGVEGRLDKKARRGRLWSFVVGHDCIADSSIRFENGQLRAVSLTVGAVPVSAHTGDVRDNWMLVHGIRTVDGTCDTEVHRVVRPMNIGIPVRVQVDLSAVEYGELMGCRLHLPSFFEAAEGFKLFQKSEASLQEVVDEAARMWEEAQR